MMLTIRALLLSPYGKNVAKPLYKPKGAQFAKHCYCTPLNLRFDLDVWCFASERHFAALTLRFSLNLIAVQKVANL